MQITNISEAKAQLSLAGEITIAPDFDELPDDLVEAFGVRSR